MDHNWKHRHVNINLFETLDIYGTTMALQVKKMLTTSIMLRFFNVKEEGINLSTITIALTFVVLCKVLGCNTIHNELLGAHHV